MQSFTEKNPVNPPYNPMNDFGAAAMQHPAAVGAVAVGIGVVIGAAALAVRIHADMTAIQPLSPEDLIRHGRLLNSMNTHRPKKPATSEKPAGFDHYSWILDNKKPVLNPDFIETANRLKAEADALKTGDVHNNDIRAIMLHHISKLYFSLSTRSVFGDILRRGTWHVVRPGGIECMFYEELADWILVTASRLPVCGTHETTVAYGEILAYCENIKTMVITDSYSEKDRNNPYSTLLRLISILKHHHAKLEELEKARNFNALINELNDNVLELASLSLTTLYLLIDGVEDTTFMIDRFTSPASMDQKFLATRKTVLGDWLHKTLNAVGLAYSTFEPTKILSLEHDVKRHLDNQHPDDEGYIKSTLNAGHRPFAKKPNATYPNGIKKSEDYLLTIRDFSRLILELYSTHNGQLLASKVNENYGAVWMYGHPAGKATLNTLMASLLITTKKHADLFNTFWQAYYHDDFTVFQAKNHIDVSQAEYAPIVHIDHILLARMRIVTEKIKANKDTILEKVKAFTQEGIKIEQSKIAYISEVLALARYHNQTETEDYKIALAELNSLLSQDSKSSIPVTVNLMEANLDGDGSVVPFVAKKTTVTNCTTTVKWGNKSLPLFVVTRKLLKSSTEINTALNSTLDCILLPRPTKFHSKVQENMYDDFLVAYNTVVNNYAWLSGFRNISPLKIARLTDLYARVNATMKIIYGSVNAIEPTPMEIALIDRLLHDKVTQSFRTYNFDGYSPRWQDPCMQITSGEKEIEIKLDGLKLTVVKEELAEHVKKAMGCFDVQEIELSQVTKERDEYKAKLVDKDSEVMDKDNELSATKSELSATKSGWATTKKELSTANKELLDNQKIIAQMQRDLIELRRQIPKVPEPNTGHSDQKDNTHDAPPESSAENSQRLFTRPNSPVTAQSDENTKSGSYMKK